MRFLLSSCCIIFATFSFNAYGMDPEESEGKNVQLKTLYSLVNKRVEEHTQTLNSLREISMSIQKNIQFLQGIEQNHKMLFKKSKRETSDQDTPSLSILLASTMKTRARIELLQENTRICTLEAFEMMPQESWRKEISSWTSSLEALRDESLTISTSLTELSLNVGKHAAELEKKYPTINQKKSGLKHHNSQLKIDKQVVIGTKTEGIHKKNEEEDKTEKDYKAELEQYRNTANLFINNSFKKNDRNPLKPHLGVIYEPKDDKKKVDHRLVNGLFDKAKEPLKHFPDHDLLFKLSVLFLYSNHENAGEEALRLGAHAICAQYQEDHLCGYTEVTHYLELLSLLTLEKPNCTPIIEQLVDVIERTQKYIDNRKIKGNLVQTKFCVKNSFVGYCETLFSALSGSEKCLRSEYADALFHSIALLLRGSPHNEVYFIDALCQMLYDNYGPQNLTPLVKFHYATGLARKKDYSKAIAVCKPLLCELPDFNLDRMVPDVYANLGTFYSCMDDFPQALQFYEDALKLSDKKIRIHWDYACTTLKYNPSNPEALKTLNDLIGRPADERKKAGLNSFLMHTTYQSYLEKADKSDELLDLILAKQEKALAKRLNKERQQANAIKDALAENKKQEQRRTNNTNNTNNTPSQKPRPINTTTPSSTITSSESLFSEAPSQREKYVIPEIKEKKKTRGVANIHIIEEKPQEKRQELIYIETLTTNKNARAIFNKLFTIHQGQNCFDDGIKISLHEINSLFHALNQKVDSSQGKGSHTKVTVNLQADGSVMEEQMIILTKSTYLKEYIIKKIRETFVNARVVPNDSKVISRLKEEGSLDD